MIARTPIISALIMEDMSNITFFHKLDQYVEILQPDVDYIIKYGVDRYMKRFERIVAYILGLKRFIPKGWKPTLKVIEVEPRQLSFYEKGQDGFGIPGNKRVDNLKWKARQDNVHLMGKKTQVYWTDEEVSELIRMHDEGISYEEIGRKLGRSAISAQSKYFKYSNMDRYQSKTDEFI